MRIQNNITAMNTHRMYTINNDNVAKAAEKLSSGYRINRAGDDAAGLAISEKMRSQIRGLNMATKNSQDAISLVQTAEGALQETQNMLQRMNELAVQAATGTNQEFDRTQAAKEFEQLKREINDVAESTTFNNMKVLDGSLSYNGYVRSAATAGVNATIEDVSSAANKAVELKEATAYKAGSAAVDAAPANTTIANKADNALKTALAANNAAVGTDTYTLEIGTSKYTVNATEVATAGDVKKALEAKIAAAAPANGEKVAIGTDNIVVTDGGNGVSENVKFYKTAATGAAVTGTAQASNTDANSFTGWTTTAVGGLGTTAAAVAPSDANKDTTLEIKFTSGGATQTVTVEQNAALRDGPNLGKAFNGQTFKLQIGGEDREFKLGWSDAAGSFTIQSMDGKTVALQTGDALTVQAIAPPQEISADVTTNAASDATAAVSATQPKEVYTVKLAETLTEPKEADYATRGEYLAAKETYDQKAAENKTALQDGGTISYNGKDYTYKMDGADAAKGEFGSLSDLATLINNDNKDADGNAKLTAAVTGKELTITAAQTDPTAAAGPDTTYQTLPGQLKATQNQGAGTRTTVEFDIAKMRDGDEFTISAGTKSFKVAYAEGDTRQQFMAKVEKEAGNIGTVKGNALIIENEKVVAQLSTDSLKDAKTNAMRIQVGALENEQLGISIDSMNTAGLGLDNQHLTDLESLFNGDDQDAAGAAITATRDAINKVSDQRATLGAMQNRLDHKIANLKVSSENLSAAESRIRDVDMASEMTNFTKNNILSQAATAMLAQANALPQNVLSLLG